MKKLTAKELRSMVGCSVSYRGREAVVVNAMPDMGAPSPGMLRLEFVNGGGSAIVRPSELGAPAYAAGITVGSAIAVHGEDLVARVAGRVLRVSLDGDQFIFTGGTHGRHVISAHPDITSADRLIAHWRGYVDNCKRAAAATEVVA